MPRVAEGISSFVIADATCCWGNLQLCHCWCHVLLRESPALSLLMPRVAEGISSFVIADATCCWGNLQLCHCWCHVLLRESPALSLLMPRVVEGISSFVIADATCCWGNLQLCHCWCHVLLRESLALSLLRDVTEEARDWRLLVSLLRWKALLVCWLWGVTAFTKSWIRLASFLSPMLRRGSSATEASGSSASEHVEERR